MKNVMSWIKKVSKFTIAFAIVLFGLEFGARMILSEPTYSNDFLGYTQDELDPLLPFISEKNGGSCIAIQQGFNWIQWWGFSSKKLNHECAKEFFSEGNFNIVFMGGSAMYNAEAPNFSTTLEHYATQNIQNVRSINLAESGARHTNMSIRFQQEVIPLDPDLVIFFDGYNEFNSILYGGAPVDSFYWTVAGKNRMHSLHRVFIDKAIELSVFLELGLIRTGLYASSRNESGDQINLAAGIKASST